MRKQIGLVLFSGGMDSVLLLHQSLDRYDLVEALHFSYGQPGEAAEWSAAKQVADRIAVPIARATIRGAVLGVPGFAPLPGCDRGVSLANMPARNLVFIATAASFAGERWGNPALWRDGGGDKVTILLGAVFDDVAHFPDCRRAFQRAATQAACEALHGIVDCCVHYPFADVPKPTLLKWFRESHPGAIEDIRDRSMSCYAGRDCGTCDACLVRAAAFKQAGMEDR